MKWGAGAIGELPSQESRIFKSLFHGELISREVIFTGSRQYCGIVPGFH